MSSLRNFTPDLSGETFLKDSFEKLLQESITKEINDIQDIIFITGQKK